MLRRGGKASPKEMRQSEIKVQDDFFAEDGFVYAKVIGDEPSYCYMPCTYTPPTYIVKVNNLGRIVKWYRYPRFVKALKEFFGQGSRAMK